MMIMIIMIMVMIIINGYRDFEHDDDKYKDDGEDLDLVVWGVTH